MGFRCTGVATVLRVFTHACIIKIFYFIGKTTASARSGSIIITSRMQASGERSPALHRRPRTRSKLLTPGITQTFNSGGISHWADI